MMDWTDRHCRFFHRQITRRALLYTEMVTAPALVRGGAVHLLDHHPAEHPVALQLGGSDPAELKAATELAAARGFAEVNLNVGCPSDRVQSGTFGAVLMRQPDLVADCVRAMGQVPGVEITVKCRLGVDEQEPRDVLPDFIERVSSAGVRRFSIHARKAWLQGLSPKENREVPPLDYPLVYAMKERFADLHLSINGGIGSVKEAEAHLAHMDGVMIGRAAYQSPYATLAEVDQRIFGDDAPPRRAEEVLAAMRPYIAGELARGTRLHSITRHMLGLFTGRPGARAWRRVLSEGAQAADAGLEVLDAAFAAVNDARKAA